MNIPFSPPDISEAEISAVADAMRSGWITTGPRTKEFEKKIKEYTASCGALCLNSQTACAEMTLRLLGIGPGDEVIVPAYTYTATASVICHVGAHPVLIDCAADGFEMDYDKAAAAVNGRTKAIIPVDVGGVPCDYDRIFDVVRAKANMFCADISCSDADTDTPLGLKILPALGRMAVLSDSAHSFGAEYKGRRSGCIADFSAFSFHAVKNLTTAEGGALTWMSIPGVDDAEIYRAYQLLSLHGQSKDALAKTQLGAWEYDIVGTWYKCNMTDIAAAFGMAQFDRYGEFLTRREQIVRAYDEAFKPLGIETLCHYTDTHRSSGHLYITRIPGIGEETRNEVIRKMAAAGIACNVHYKPLPMHTAYKKLGYDIADFPYAYAKFEGEVTLPLHTKLSDAEVEYVIENYTRVLCEVLR